MPNDLAGNVILFDKANSVLLSGRLALHSDGASRSEIVIAELEGDREERLVFARGSSWAPVYHLIQVIRELYDSGAVVRRDPSAAPCDHCGGQLMYEDAEGNWRDCGACVP